MAKKKKDESQVKTYRDNPMLKTHRKGEVQRDTPITDGSGLVNAVQSSLDNTGVTRAKTGTTSKSKYVDSKSYMKDAVKHRDAVARRNEEANANRFNNLVKSAYNSAKGGYQSAIATSQARWESQNKDKNYNTYLNNPMLASRDKDGNLWTHKSRMAQFEGQMARADETLAKSQAQLEQAKYGLGKAGQFGIEAAQQAMLMGTDIAASAVVPGAGLALMGARSFGQGANEARQDGYDINQQANYGLLSASVEMATEKLFQGVSLMGKAYGGGVFKKLSEDQIQEYATRWAKNMAKTRAGATIAQAAVKAGLAGVGEGMEEVLSDLANPMIKKMVGMESEGYDAREIGRDFLMGAVLGTVMGGGSAVLDNYNGKGITDEDMAEILAKAETVKLTDEAKEVVDNYKKDVEEGKQITDAQKLDVAKAVIPSINEEADMASDLDDKNLLGKMIGVQFASEEDAGVANGAIAKELETVAQRIQASFDSHPGAETEAQSDENAEASGEANLLAMTARGLVSPGGLEAHIEQLMPGNQATREAFAEVTGVELPEDIAGTRQEVINYMRTARVDLANNIGSKMDEHFNNTYSGDLTATETAQSYGESGRRGYSSTVSKVYNTVSNTANMSTQAKRNAVWGTQRAYEAYYSAGVDSTKETRGEVLARLNDTFKDSPLTKSERMAAFMAGENDKAQLHEAIEKVSKKEKPGKGRERAKAKRGTVDVRTEDDAFTEEQIKTFETFAKALNVNIRLEDASDKAGVNGFYDNNGTIVVYKNVNGDFRQNPYVTTVAHEFTHHLQITAVKEYQAFKDYVTSQLNLKAPDGFEKEINKRIKSYKEVGQNLTREQAIDEILADSAERFLTDPEFARELANKNKSLAEKLVDFLTDFIAKVKALIQDGSELTNYGEFYDTLEIFEQARDLYAQAIEASVDNEVLDKEDQRLILNGGEERMSIATWFKSLAKTTSTQKPTEKLVDKIASGKEVTRDTMLQNGFTEEDFAGVDKFMDAMSKVMEEAGVKYHFLGIDDINNAEVQVRRTKKGKVRSVIMSAMVKNGEYPVNFDFTTVCKKRQTFMKVLDELSKNGTTDTISLDADKLFMINQALKEEGIETACLGCFVEARRYNIKNYTDKVVNLWNGLVDEVRAEQGLEGEAEYFDFGTEGADVEGMDFDAVEKAWNEYSKDKNAPKGNPTARLKTILTKGGADFQKYLRPSDLITEEGVNGLKAMSHGKQNLFTQLKSAYGTAAPKEVNSFTPYNNEIALLPKTMSKKATAKYLRGIGGVRMQSFSDFLVANTFDYMQMVADLAARKFPAHAYTKEIAFARIFGMTGIKINMSVMFDMDTRLGKGYGGLRFVTKEEYDLIKKDYPIKEDYTLDGVDGYLIYNVADQENADRVEKELYDKAIAEGKSVEEAHKYAMKNKPFAQSINWKEAKALQNEPGYSDNIGTIGVGFSARHIRMMMRDPNIRYIIPYHASGMPGVIKARTNLDIADDFTDYQNTRRLVVKSKGGQEVKMDLKKYLKDAKGDWVKAIDALTVDAEANGWSVDIKGSKALAGHGDFDLYSDLGTKTPEEKAQEYMDWCADNGYVPLFHEFATEDGYYKTLFDFNVKNAQGETCPQGVVTNKYPGIDVSKGETDTSRLSEIIDAEMNLQNNINQYIDSKVGNVVDDISQQWADMAEEETGRYSKTVDSEGNELSLGQLDYFNDSKVRDSEGRLLKVFHGTKAHSLTVFKYSNSVEQGYWFTSNEEQAGMYAGEEDIPGEVLAEKRNPYDSALDYLRQSGLDVIEGEHEYDDDETLWNFKIIVKPDKYGRNEDATPWDVQLSSYDYDEKPTLEQAAEEWLKDPDLNYAIEGTSFDLRNIYETYLNITNPMEVDANGAYWEEIEFEGGTYSTNDLATMARERGYDGIIIKQVSDPFEPMDVYVAFESNQIKSVHNANPTEDPDIRYSKSVDSDGNALSVGQDNFFKDSQARNDDGNLLKMYHGSNTPNFTVFDPSFSDDGRSLFFTSNPKVADSYTHSQDHGKELDAYELPHTIKTAKQFNDYQRRHGNDMTIGKITKESLQPLIEDIEKRVERKRKDIERTIERLSTNNLYDNEEGRSRIANCKADLAKYEDEARAEIENLEYEIGRYGIFGDHLYPAWGTSDNPDDLVKVFTEDSYHLTNTMGNKYPVYLNIVNPLVIDATEYGVEFDRDLYLRTTNEPGKYDLYDKYNHDYVLRDATIPEVEAYFEKNGAEAKSDIFGESIEYLAGVVESKLEEFSDMSSFKRNDWVQEAHIKEITTHDNISGKWNNIKVNTGNTTEIKGKITKSSYDGDAFTRITIMQDGRVAASQTFTERMIGESPTSELVNYVISMAGLDTDLGDDFVDSLVSKGEYTESRPETRRMKTREVAQMAEERGHDGVIFKNLKDTGGYAAGDPGASTVIIAFDSNQVKATNNLNPTEDPDSRYSVATDAKGNKVVVIDENIFDAKVKGEKDHKFIAEFIATEVGNSYDILQAGVPVYIGEDLPGEFTQSKYTDWLLKNRPGLLKAKNKTVNNLGELIEIAKYSSFEANIKAKHSSDAKYGFYKYSTRFAIKTTDGSYMGYTAELLIRRASDKKMYLYDIMDIKKTGPLTLTTTNGGYHRGKKPSPVNPVNTNVPQSTDPSQGRNSVASKEAYVTESSLKAEQAKSRRLEKRLDKDLAKERLKLKKDKAIAREKRKHREYKANQKEKKERREVLGKIKKRYENLYKTLSNPTDAKHLPDGFDKAVADFLAPFNFETDRSKPDSKSAQERAQRYFNVADLADKLEKAAEDNDSTLIIDPAQVAIAKRVNKVIQNKRLADLTLEELQDVYKLMRLIDTVISKANKSFTDGVTASINERAQQAIQETRDRGKVYKKGKAGDMLNQYLTSNTKPRDFFRVLTKEGGALYEAYMGMRKAFNRHIDNMTDFRNAWDKAVNYKQVKEWRKQSTKFKLESGQEIRLTVPQIMSLYELNKRDQARSHIYGVGIQATDEELTKKALKEDKGKRGENPYIHRGVMVTVKDVERICRTLTDDQRKVANNLQRIMSTMGSEWGNQASLTMYNYKKFTEKNYFPISVMETWLEEKAGVPQAQRIRTLGMTKPVQPNANKPIAIDDIFSVTVDHMNKMSMYTMTPELTDFERIWNYTESDTRTSLKAEFEATYGKNASAYVSNLMNNVNGYFAKDENIAIFDKMLSTFKRAKVGASIRVLVQQPTAILRAGAYINPAYITAGMSQPNFRKARDEMFKYSQIARWKSWGFYETDTAKSMESIIENKRELADLTMGAYGVADNMAWVAMWNAVKIEVGKKNPKIAKGSPEFFEKVAERFEEVVDHTQVVDSVFHRSQLMRSKNVLIKGATAFMSEPTTTVNMLQTELLLAHQEAQAGEKGKAAKRVSKVMATLIATGVATSIASAAVDALRHSWTGGDDDDEDKSLIQSLLLSSNVEALIQLEGLLAKWKHHGKDEEMTYLDRWIEHTKKNVPGNINPLQMMPFIKDIFSIVDGYSVERADISLISNVWDSVDKFKQYMAGDSSYGLAYIINDAIGSVGELAGIPYKNFSKDVIGLLRTGAEVAGHGDYANYLYNSTMYSQKSWNVEREVNSWLIARRKGNYADADKIRKSMMDKSGMTEADFNKVVQKMATDGLKDAIVAGDAETVRNARTTLNDAGWSKEDIDKVIQDTYKKAFRDALETYDLSMINSISNRMRSEGFDKKDIVAMTKSKYMSAYKDAYINGEKGVLRDIERVAKSVGVSNKDLNAIKTVVDKDLWKIAVYDAAKSGNRAEYNRLMAQAGKYYKNANTARYGIFEQTNMENLKAEYGK